MNKKSLFEESFFKICSAYSTHIALTEFETGKNLTFSEIFSAILRMFALLRDCHIKKGDVVSVVAENSIDLVVNQFGVMLYGAIINPINPKFTQFEISTILNHSESKLLVTSEDFDTNLNNIRKIGLQDYQLYPLEEATQSDLDDGMGAMLIYTSGTTGHPKGVLLSRRNMISNIKIAIDWFNLNSSHISCCILPLFHTFGFISDLSTMLFTGGRCVILKDFDIKKLISLDLAITNYKIKSFSAVPLLFEMMIKLGSKLGPSLAYVISGAAPLSVELEENFFNRFKISIIPAYGLSETTCFCTISYAKKSKRIKGSSGIPAGLDLKIVSESETELPVGQIGEIFVKGQSVMASGYFKEDIHPFSQDGWLKTGDLGYQNKDGFVFITGRKKNMIIRGGEKIYLEDIDFILKKCPVISDSATIKQNNDKAENMLCFVVPCVSETEEILRSKILNFLHVHVGRKKFPDKIIFTQKIPRTATNKIKIAMLAQTTSCL